jgi:hypothetical protein
MSNVVEPNIINPKIISAFDKSTFSPAFVKPNLNTSVSQITEKPKEEERFPYLVLEEFIIKNKWENKMGGAGIQELPINKNSIVFLPTTVHQEQYEKALNDGKLKKIEYVNIKSLVDKEVGKCNPTTTQIMQMDYNPCRRVKKGQIVRGYIHPISNVFTSVTGMMSIPQLSKGEYEVLNQGSENSTPKDNNNLINIALLLGVGYVVYRLIKK